MSRDCHRECSERFDTEWKSCNGVIEKLHRVIVVRALPMLRDNVTSAA